MILYFFLKQSLTNRLLLEDQFFFFFIILRFFFGWKNAFLPQYVIPLCIFIWVLEKIDYKH